MWKSINYLLYVLPVYKHTGQFIPLLRMMDHLSEYPFHRHPKLLCLLCFRRWSSNRHLYVWNYFLQNLSVYRNVLFHLFYSPLHQYIHLHCIFNAIRFQISIPYKQVIRIIKFICFNYHATFLHKHISLLQFFLHWNRTNDMLLSYLHNVNICMDMIWRQVCFAFHPESIPLLCIQISWKLICHSFSSPYFIFHLMILHSKNWVCYLLYL